MVRQHARGESNQTGQIFQGDEQKGVGSVFRNVEMSQTAHGVNIAGISGEAHVVHNSLQTHNDGNDNNGNNVNNDDRNSSG